MSSKFYYKLMAGFYDLLDVIYFCNYKNSPRKKVLEAIKDQDTILDLCTGTATNAIQISQVKPNTKIVGIDLSKDMLRIADDKLKKSNIKNVKLYYMDATHMKFNDKYFDKIIISLVLHELEDTLAEQILKEARRVLKNDGEIIVTEWETSNITWRKIVFFPIHILEPKTYRAFIKKDLYAYFKKFGLEIIEVSHCDYSKVLRVKKVET